MVKPGALLAQALAAHRAGQLPQARDLYQRLLEADPQNVDALNLLGVLLSQTGDLPQACEALERAVAAKPQYAEASANLGMVLRQAGRHQEESLIAEAVGHFVTEIPITSAPRDSQGQGDADAR